MLRHFVPVLWLISTAAFASDYTRAELERMTHADLVDIVLDLQGGSSDQECTTIDPYSGARPSILTFVNNPGYTNHGTLKWPDGSVFMLRNSGYTNDKTLSYPDGQVMIRENQGYTNHKTIYWPNGQTYVLRNSGRGNDGSIYRHDGTVWLKRNRGYSDDRTRYGFPVNTVRDGDLEAKGRLTSEDNVDASVTLRGGGWSIEVKIDSATNSVRVRECFDF